MNLKTKVLFKNKWFSVIERESDNGSMMTGLEPSHDGIVVLPYTTNEIGEIDLFGIIYECNPLRPDGFWNTCITGGIDDNEDALEAAKRELFEESGYEQRDDDKWSYLGNLFVSKLVDSELSCFAVDITDIKIKNKKGDGTKNEELSKFNLVSLDKLILEEDCYILSMLMKFYVKNFGGIFRGSL